MVTLTILSSFSPSSNDRQIGAEDRYCCWYVFQIITPSIWLMLVQVLALVVWQQLRASQRLASRSPSSRKMLSLVGDAP